MKKVYTSELTPLCFSRRDGSKHVLDDLARSISRYDLRSRSDPIGICSHTAYQMMGLDQESRLVPLTSLKHHYIVVYWQTVIYFLTRRQMIFPGAPCSKCHRVIPIYA